MYSSSQTTHAMALEIRDSRKLHELQSEFSNAFPYLKLEFFKAPHRIGEASSRSQLHDQNKTVSDCRMKKSEGLLHINREMTVSQLEARLYDDFGLSAQVFRKSGNVWLETSATDAWTLAQQNEEGAELSRKIQEERTNPDDTDLY
ncbi:MAG: hypothetical protein ACKOQY_11145 [Bacteroidota bacterium]